MRSCNVYVCCLGLASSCMVPQLELSLAWPGPDPSPQLLVGRGERGGEGGRRVWSAMSTINLVTRSKRKSCHKLHAASISILVGSTELYYRAQQHPVQSHQTLLPPSPPLKFNFRPAPGPTNRRGKATRD